MATCASLESAPTSASNALAVGALAQAAHAPGYQRDELVVGRLLDVDALNRGARLAAVEHGAPDRGVRRPLEIGVGEHDHRVLSAELEAVRDQPLGSAPGDLPARARGAGELDEIGFVDQRGAGRSRTGQALEHPRSTHVLAPAADDLARGERRELRRLDRDRRARQQRGHRIDQGPQDGEVEWADDADDRKRPVGDRELLARGQQAVRSRMRVGQEPLGAPSVVLEQVDREGNLQGRLLPRLSRLALEQRGDPFIVVEQPVTQAPDPLTPAARSERLPGRLVAPQPRDGGAYLLGALIRQRRHHRPIHGRPHLEARARWRAVSRPARSDRRRARSRHLGVARAHQLPIVPPRARLCESTSGPDGSTRARTRSEPVVPHIS